MKSPERKSPERKSAKEFCPSLKVAQAIIETDLSGAHTPKSSKHGTATPRTMTSPKCMCKSGCEVELKGSHVLEVVLEECVYCISITA